jgi:hypothetical protein
LVGLAVTLVGLAVTLVECLLLPISLGLAFINLGRTLGKAPVTPSMLASRSSSRLRISAADEITSASTSACWERRSSSVSPLTRSGCTLCLGPAIADTSRHSTPRRSRQLKLEFPRQRTGGTLLLVYRVRFGGHPSFDGVSITPGRGRNLSP